MQKFKEALVSILIFLPFWAVMVITMVAWLAFGIEIFAVAMEKYSALDITGYNALGQFLYKLIPVVILLSGLGAFSYLMIRANFIVIKITTNLNNKIWRKNFVTIK